MKPIDPYKFQGKDLEFIERLKGGKYRVSKDVAINLGFRPISAKKNGKWSLDMDGILKVEKGYEFDGPSVINDLPTRMLASLVHDILCEDTAQGAYSYWRKNKIFSDIEEAQGEPWLTSSAHFVGLLLGNWAWR